MKTPRLVVLLLGVALVAPAAARADTVVSYNFNVVTSGRAAATSTAANVTATSVAARDTTAASTSQGRSGAAILASGFADADNNAFVFSLTVADGFALDLTSFSVFARAADAGPGTSTLFVNGQSRGKFANTTSFPTDAASVPLSLTNLTGTVSFSLVGTGPAANSASTFASFGSLVLDDLLVQGSVGPVSVVPTPAGAAPAALCGLTLLRRRRAGVLHGSR